MLVKFYLIFITFLIDIIPDQYRSKKLYKYTKPIILVTLVTNKENRR